MEIAVLREFSNDAGPIEQTISLDPGCCFLSCKPASSPNWQSLLMIDFAFVRSISPSSPILISLGSGTCFIKLIIVNAIIIRSLNDYIFWNSGPLPPLGTTQVIPFPGDFMSQVLQCIQFSAWILSSFLPALLVWIS